MSKTICPSCGAPLPKGKLFGHCPRCLARAMMQAAPERSGEVLNRVGDYELVEEIGRGGMGVIYRARQVSLDRFVALKMIHGGVLADPSYIQRFRQEASAAARLQHPHILTVYEWGESGGQPYFTMELVEGHDLATLTREVPVPSRDAARYLESIAQAVHHAHEQGVLHRDLKPSNILIDPFDQPRITDFGIARRIDQESEQTVTGLAMGSPAYMPPEQALGNQGRQGPWSDVYALGAVLYHLLTGRPPFQGETLHTVLLQLQTAEPLPPRRLNPSVPRDLETICLKCLEKNPHRRYASAAALAAELGRFLRDEPIEARPITALARAARWSRKRPALVGSLLALFLATLGGLTGILWQWSRAERSAHRENEHRLAAEASERLTRLNLYAADVAAAAQAIERGDFGLGRRLLDAHKPKPGHPDYRGFEWEYLRTRCEGDQEARLDGHESIVTCVAISPRGDRMASGSQDGTARVWSRPGGQLLHVLPVAGAAWTVQFTPEGDRLITGGSDRRVRVWDYARTNVVTSFPGQIAALAYQHPWLAAAESSLLWWEPAGVVTLWNYATGEKLFQLPQPGRSLSFATNDQLLAVAGAKTGAAVWDLNARRYVREFKTPEQVLSVALSGDASALVAAGRRDAWVWHLDQGGEPLTVPHPLTVWSVAVSPDGESWASACSDRGLRLFSLRSGRPVDVLWGHGDEIWSVGFSPDSQELVTGGKDRSVMRWRMPQAEFPSRNAQSIPHQGWVRPIFSDDGQFMITQDASRQSCEVWNWREATPLARVTNGVVLGFKNGSAELCFLSPATESVERWNWRENRLLDRDAVGQGSDIPNYALAGASADGKHAYWIGGRQVHLFETDSGRVWRELTGPKGKFRSAALTRDGTHFAMATEGDYAPWLWNVSEGRHRRLEGHRDFVSGLAFSPDGTLLATGSVDGAIKLWDTRTGHLLDTLVGHLEEATDVVFSPDGNTLASVGFGSAVMLWHVPTHRALLTIPMPKAGYHLQFTPDGRTLAVTVGTFGDIGVEFIHARLPGKTAPAR